MKHFKVIAVLLLFGLAGCAEADLASHVAKTIPGNSGSKGDFKVGNPYKVSGKWYRPTESYTLVETGIASWYGPNFHGKKTANGEVFNKHELTAAHRTLQMPSLVRVTNLDNGRTLVVRVNDRGPFKRGRIIDLSERAAELLQFKNNGTAKVRLEVLGRESRAMAEAAKRGEDTRGVEVAMNESAYAHQGGYSRVHQSTHTPAISARAEPAVQVAGLPPAVESDVIGSGAVQGHSVGGKFYPDPVVDTVAVAPTSIYVQAGSFGNLDNANKYAQSLQRFGQAKVYPAMVNGQQFYRVRIAAANVSNADAVLARMANSGMSNAIIVVD